MKGVLGLIGVLWCFSSFGCWGPPLTETSLEESFSRAKYIVIAAAEDVIQINKHRYQDPRDFVEDVKFRVLYRFKGDREISEILISHTDLEFGCNVSAFNQPVWLDALEPVRIPLTPEVPNTPTRISGVWLIFADMEPFILDDQRSHPIELVSTTDWLTLFGLSIQSVQLSE